ncbi:MAG: hypothetical protein IH840_03215 [Candidatus Heimdallarchaeota archaeon]|nr:hypothetical protein [Candidatus Heimdallarchaeota archaeon]
MGIDNIFDALREYHEVFNRPVPVNYEVLRLSDEHRKLDALMRRYWKNIHPLSRDLFTSFANEFQYLNLQIFELEQKLEAKQKETEMLTETINQKLAEFEQTFENKVLDGVASITSKRLDSDGDVKNQLKHQILELQRQLSDKEEMIQSLRGELSLVIDDTDQQIASRKKMQGELTESIELFDEFSKNLDVLETKLEVLQKENDVIIDEKSRLENDFATSLKEQDRIVANFTQENLRIDQKYHSTLDKLKAIKPSIQVNIEEHDKIKAKNQNLAEKNIELGEIIANLESRVGAYVFLEKEDDGLQIKMLDLEKKYREAISSKELLKSKFANQLKLNAVMKKLLDKSAINLEFSEVKPQLIKERLQVHISKTNVEEKSSAQKEKPPESVKNINKHIRKEKDDFKSGLLTSMKTVRRKRAEDKSRTKFTA